MKALAPMSKQESQVLKGVAILLMLFLHLFIRERDVALMHHTLYLQGTPLVSWLTRMANPVAFFVTLSGYGLYAVWEKGDNRRWIRLIQLVLHYWLLLAIFLAVGSYVAPSHFPHDWLSLLRNFTAYDTTYNGEHWFLLPYILLAVTSSWLFQRYHRRHAFIVLATTWSLSLCASASISLYGEAFLYSHRWAYYPVVYLSFLFSFTLGALSCKNHWLGSAGNIVVSRLAWPLLFLLCAMRCLTTSSVGHSFFVFAFMWLWLQAPRPSWLNKCLAHLGRYAMLLWLSHTFFCYYIFHDWIYSFQYPVLIFCVLIFVSYLSSRVIECAYALLFGRWFK